MSRKALIYLLVISYAIIMLRFIFLVFGDTHDNGLLTLFSLVTGLMAAVVIYFIFDNMHYLIAIFLGVVLSTTLIATMNHKMASGEVTDIYYTITGTGRLQFKGSVIDYIEVSFQGISADYTISKLDRSKYVVGNPLLLQTKTGYWGYPIIGEFNE
jgi:hypothetical protein